MSKTYDSIDEMLNGVEGGVRQYRRAEVVELMVCTRGDVAGVTPTGKSEWQVLHACGKWTWCDANYCGGCGKRLQAEAG